MAFAAMLKQLRKKSVFHRRILLIIWALLDRQWRRMSLLKGNRTMKFLKSCRLFDVSIDYLLGRTNCRDATAAIIGKNIDLIRGNLTYKELSEDISAKLGALIFPEMLELYARGERMPFVGTIKILAKYAQVRDSFFTPITLQRPMKERKNCTDWK